MHTHSVLRGLGGMLISAFKLASSMHKLIHEILVKVCLFSVLGFATVSTSFAQVTASAFFVSKQALIPEALTNAVAAFGTGAKGNNDNIVDGTANDFTLTFTQGLNVGTARFVATDNYGISTVNGIYE